MFLCELIRVSQEPYAEKVLDIFHFPGDEGRLSGILNQQRFCRANLDSNEKWVHTDDNTLVMRVSRPPHLTSFKKGDY